MHSIPCMGFKVEFGGASLVYSVRTAPHRTAPHRIPSARERQAARGRKALSRSLERHACLRRTAEHLSATFGAGAGPVFLLHLLHSVCAENRTAQ
jgi:hypothetical protein